MDGNIWDEPVIQGALPHTAKARDQGEEDYIQHRPTKRPRQTLFYADSDDDFEREAPPAQEIDVDALFEGLDDEDMALPAIVNEEDLARQAEARYRERSSPLLTPHEILPSSSPSREANTTSGDKGRENTKEGQEKKTKRRQLRLDENLLLGPTGFPQLVKMTKDFTIKGKGHEAADLDRLLRIYQYWTHQLYPKTTFSDTVERIEQLCHSRRMHVALSVWQDEARGKVQDDDGDQETSIINQNSSLQSSSPRRSPTHHLSSPLGNNVLPSQTVASNSMEETDPEFWKMLEAGMEAPVVDIPSAPPTTCPSPSIDEDETMWAVVDEIEKEVSGATSPLEPAPVAVGPLSENHPPDDDWEDMYA